MRLLELSAGERDALADLPRGLRRTLVEAPLELGHISGDEDRDGARNLALHLLRPFELELEHADTAVGRDPVHLAAEGAVALARDVLHVLEEVAILDSLDERLLAEEPVLAPLLLPRALRPCRRRDGDLELGDALDELADQRALAGAEGPVMTNTRPLAATIVAGPHRLLKRLTSSARWRSESPPTVFDWLIRHWFSRRWP